MQFLREEKIINVSLELCYMYLSCSIYEVLFFLGINTGESRGKRQIFGEYPHYFLYSWNQLVFTIVLPKHC